MYFDRYIDAKIEKALKSSGAILVSGPKFCGKTTTCMRFQESYIKLNNSQTIDIARLNPKDILEGEKPRLIDEWQKAPNLWDLIKSQLDEDYQFGQYILTGSSTPVDKAQIHHSGAGRITPIAMRTMSLFESKDSQGLVSLKELIDGEKVSFNQNIDFSLDEMAYLTCRGGWPISVLADKQIALDVTKNYYDSLFIFEDYENEQFRGKKALLFRAILKSYARNISTEASIATILKDVRQSEERSIDRKTIDSYLEALRDIFIIQDIDAWNPNIRSKTSIRSTPTRHFVDTSLACCALGLSPQSLVADLNTFGLMFEDLAVRDLVIYASMVGGNVLHYRDNTGLECDSVLKLEDGRWAAIEIKLGGEKLIDEGAKNLNRLERKIIEKGSIDKPLFKMVLTATGPMYTRDDNVMVVPLNLLQA